MDTSPFQKIIGIKFKDQDLLTESLTHRSYLNENPKVGLSHNERLEYLGDAVLELIVSEELFEKFPKQPEGQLTVLRAALVNYQILAKVAEMADAAPAERAVDQPVHTAPRKDHESTLLSSPSTPQKKLTNGWL